MSGETTSSSGTIASGHAPVTVLWLRRDLRLGDNPALLEAVDRAVRDRDGQLLPVYVWEPRERRAWAPGGAARWWLWHSLRSLLAGLQKAGSRLLLERGEPVAAVAALARAPGIRAVVWAEGLEPDELADDAALTAALRSSCVDSVCVPQVNLLARPLHVHTRAGRPYAVFSPFWRAHLAVGMPDEPLPPPSALPPAPSEPRGLSLNELRHEAVAPWADGFSELWTPGEPGAHERLEAFVSGPLANYAADRDRPDLDGSSRLSPRLRWGELTARQVWHAVRGVLEEAGTELEASVTPPSWDEEQAPGLRRSAGAFLRQLGWREFGHHLLVAFPRSVSQPLHARFAAFPWRDDPAGLSAWRTGATGFPIVDAAMRSLWATGWLHNRARLLAGSFLVKDLLLPWQEGAAWFWDTLVDADLAANTLGWQWVGGCGADAAPYFRVFNPVKQGLRFDPGAAFVRRWVPELAGLPAEQAQAPWLAAPGTLAVAGIRLGTTYPKPIVDHGEARLRALAAYDTVRKR
jgi:deoxyribodipyrimidine photo-lyase